MEFDDDDWFNKDENKLLDEIKPNNDNEPQMEVEYITTSNTDNACNVDETYQLPIVYSVKTANKKQKLPIKDLRKVAEQTEHDAFLYIFTSEPSFFKDQISSNDSQERVLLYLRIVVKSCSLEISYFQFELMQHIMQNAEFLEHLRIIATKLFSRKCESMWKDEKNCDQIVSDLQAIFLQAHQTGVLSTSQQGIQLLSQIKQLLTRCNTTNVAQNAVCLEFATLLDYLEEKYAGCNNVNDRKSAPVDAETKKIYPELDELLNDNNEYDNTKQLVETNNELLAAKDATVECRSAELLPIQSCKTVEEYISQQKRMLREDLLHMLRAAVRQLKHANTLPAPMILHEDVCIILNEQFFNANRHEMLFVDMLGSRREHNIDTAPTLPKLLRKSLENLKTGELLCFATDNNFDNLILATVSYTDKEVLNAGYIGIEIVRQYNIGNIYQTKFLMFQAPTFFEPYNNVYFKLCSISNLSMKSYIIDGETKSATPSYMKPTDVYTYELQKFSPFKQIPDTLLPLNAAQRLAFQNALTHEFSLIQGPPGTGKTHLSVHLVKTLIENATTPIVLITYTNESLDKFLLKLSSYTNSIVRFGSQTRLPEIKKFNISGFNEHYSYPAKLKHLYYLTKSEFQEKFMFLQNMYKEFDGTDDSYQQILNAQRNLHIVGRKLETIKIIFNYYVAREKSVIAMTTTCAAKISFLFHLLKSAVVIFEEASEILECQVVACLTPYTKHVIMIGDHMQLQPYSTYTAYSKKHHLNISLFERLIKHNFEHTVLTTQYRMHPAIADLIRNSIYKQLENAVVVENYAPIRKMKCNLYCVTHAYEETAPENQQESSFYNAYEITKIHELATYLIKNAHYAAQDIVVLTPYVKQVELIKKEFQEKAENSLLKHIKIATVDSFQGLEANIILLSLVRNNKNKQIGFLQQKNRICVALSRAKQGMYIVGNIDLLAECNAVWSTIRQKLFAQNAIGNVFPYTETC